MIFYSSNCVRRRFLLCSHFHAQLLSTSISLLQLQPLSPMFATPMTSLNGGLYIISIISNSLYVLIAVLSSGDLPKTAFHEVVLEPTSLLLFTIYTLLRKNVACFSMQWNMF